MGAPIRSSNEISVIVNNAQNALADVTNIVVKEKKRGWTVTNPKHRDNVYKMILLFAYLQNILEPNGDIRAWYTTSANEKKFNNILDGLVALSYGFQGPGIPLLGTLNIPLIVYSIGSSSPPGPPSAGVVSINTTADSPSTVVDSIGANTRAFAFWIIRIRGTNNGEGSRTSVITADWNSTDVNWSEAPSTGDLGGITTPVTFTVELNAGNIELVVNTSTNNWVVTGRRI